MSHKVKSLRNLIGLPESKLAKELQVQRANIL